MSGVLQVAAVVLVVGALVGAAWLMVTDSTEARTTDEKMRAAEQQHYDEMIRKWKDGA